ncbi:hypothetical protein DQW54_28620, partial [Escherichia coli O111:NM]|uniref:hypothetical protein n=1 Tax=Escherichia coli TaxID=562 RepID=UPI000E077815
IGVAYGPAINGRLAIRDTNGVTNTADYTTVSNGGVAVLAVNGYARLAQAAFPGAPVEGEIVNDAARRCLAARIGGMTQFD